MVFESKVQFLGEKKLTLLSEEILYINKIPGYPALPSSYGQKKMGRSQPLPGRPA